MPLKNVTEPTWNGHDDFVEPIASELWSLLPSQLRDIAANELREGNVANNIQLDLDTNVVLLAFKQPPLTEAPTEPKITVHTKHAYGNYCYDGTLCTYEFSSQIAFLAFDDPMYLEAKTGQ